MVGIAFREARAGFDSFEDAGLHHRKTFSDERLCPLTFGPGAVNEGKTFTVYPQKP